MMTGLPSGAGARIKLIGRTGCHGARVVAVVAGHDGARMRRLTTIGACLGLVLTECATMPTTAQGPCLPPGIATDVFQWAAVETGTLGNLPVEGGGSLRIAYVLYERGDRRVAIGWVGGKMFLVDPEPNSPAPPWFNEALLSTSRTMRTTPARACQWRRSGGTQA